MTASAWSIHDSFKEQMGDGTIDMDAVEFDMILCLVGSNVATAATATYAAVDNEVATNYGYTQGGQTCTGTITAANQWLRTTGTVKFDVDDVVWSASGGSITARYAAIKENAAGYLVCHTLLDTTPADVTATSGNTLTITISANGVFELT